MVATQSNPSADDLRVLVLEGDVAAAEALAESVVQGRGGDWFVAAAALTAARHPQIWTAPFEVPQNSNGEKTMVVVKVGRQAYLAPFEAWWFRSHLSRAIRERMHLTLAASITDFMATAKTSAEMAGMVAAMKAHKKAAFAAWRADYNTMLRSYHVEAFIKKLKSRDSRDEERRAFTRFSTNEGITSVACEIFEIAVRACVAEGMDPITPNDVATKMRAECAERQERAKKWRDTPDDRLLALLELMDRHKTGFAVEAAWRVRRRKRIVEHEKQVDAQLSAGTLPPFSGGVR